MTKGGNTYYYHLNGHDDVVALTNDSGAVVAQYTYDAWGNILSKSGTMKDENPYLYAGYRYDKETGLYYMMARYYDASVGRFLSRDSFNEVYYYYWGLLDIVTNGKSFFSEMSDTNSMGSLRYLSMDYRSLFIPF